MSDSLERAFPALKTTTWAITSERTPAYNCIAWAAGDSLRWWWPSEPAWWPDGAPRASTVDAFAAAFASLGYGRCDNESLEPGFEKVAIYADASGVPTHAARQLLSGAWTSKLGQREDIQHELAALEGSVYGRVALILRRPS